MLYPRVLHDITGERFTRNRNIQMRGALSECIVATKMARSPAWSLKCS